MINQHLSATPEAEKDLAQTPWWLVHQLQRLTGYTFALDVAAVASTRKAPVWFGPDMVNPAHRDALTADWGARLRGASRRQNAACFMNPPFSLAEEFCFRASFHARENGVTTVGVVKLAADADWFQQSVEGTATAIYKPDGRVQFLRPDGMPFTRVNKATGKTERSGANFMICCPVWTPLYMQGRAPLLTFTREIPKEQKRAA